MPLLTTFAGDALNTYGFSRGASTPTGFELISSSFISSTTSSITFSAIPANYTHLQLRIVARNTAAVSSSNTTLRFNGNTSGTYGYQSFRGAGATLSSPNSGSYQTSLWIGDSPGASSAASTYSFLIADILDYANTNKLKTVKTFGGNAGYLDVSIFNGIWNSTAAISSITVGDIIGSTSFAAGSRISLYGQGS
jgi:hypothetical protein